MKPGDLIKVPINCYLIKISGWNLYKIQAGDLLLCIEEKHIDLNSWPKESRLHDLQTPNKILALTSSAMLFFSKLFPPSSQTYRQVQTEFFDRLEKNQPIKGFTFLCPNGKDYVWASQNDLKHIAMFHLNN